MNKPILSRDKHLCLCYDIGNVTTFLHLAIESYKETIDKIKIIREIGIGTRVKELNKTNEAITLVDDQIHQVLCCTGSKNYVNHIKQSNLADLRDKILNQEFCHNQLHIYHMITTSNKNRCWWKNFHQKRIKEQCATTTINWF